VSEHADQNATGPTSLEPSKQSPTLPLVDRIERADHCHPDFRSQPSIHEEEHFRHSSWHVRRRKIYKGMTRCHLSGTRLDRFAECGANLWVGVDADSGELKLQCDRCHDRWCVPCGAESSARMGEQLWLAMDGKQCRFLTLTRRHNSTPLTDQLDSLYACFNRLRERAFWKATVKGGAFFVECKLNEKTRAWHLHMHLIVTGDFIPQKALSKEWLAVTQDSSIVDVRTIPNFENLARYVTKYVTKPMDSAVYDDEERMDEMIIAMRGRRLCSTFGTWRKLKLNGDEEPSKPLKQKRHLASLLYDVRQGDAAAYALWRAVVLRWPGLAVFAGGRSDVESTGPPPADDCPF
jgi:hypothetical protein